MSEVRSLKFPFHFPILSRSVQIDKHSSDAISEIGFEFEIPVRREPAMFREFVEDLDMTGIEKKKI